MRKGILETAKKYTVRKKKDKTVVVEVSSTQAEIDYWRYDEAISDESVEGTKMTLSAFVPRIAGNDFFVDHGGERVEKVVNVPYGKEIKLALGFSYNPQTGAYTMGNDLEFIE